MPARQKPNSMLEWVAGRNITPRQPRSSQQRGVLKLQVFTDDTAETDTLAVTYPRSGSSNRQTPRSSASKQVKFTDASQQALVKRDPIEQRVDSDLEVETSGSEDSVEIVQVITRKKRTKKVSPPVTPGQEPVLCLKALPVPSQADDDVEDIIPHPTCQCTKCVYGRKLLRKARRKRKAKAGIEGETAAVESLATAPAPPANSDNKGDEITNITGETAPVAADEAQTDDRVQNTKESAPDRASTTNATSAAVGSSPSRSKKQRLPKAYPAPDIRNPNLIMPPRAEVLQIEHAVETPEDPRPNAFVDHEHGICRVYHGPAYGNPYGSLYLRRGLSGPPRFQPLPAGVPHPTDNPYYNGFDPNQMARHGQPPPPGWPSGTGYVPPPPPAGYPPGHQPEMPYPMHMPWPNYQVPPEGRKEHRGHKEHKKVPSPVVPPAAPQVVPASVPAVMPVTMPPGPPPAASPPVEKSPEAAPADVTEPQKSNDRPHVSPPFGLLTPRTIAAKFNDNPVPNKGKDKDKPWDNNGSPSHRSGSHHTGSKGGGGGGWGGGSAHGSNNNNAWGFGAPANNSPRASNKDIGGGNGGGNGWGGSGGSQRSGSKKSSNNSRNSANQPAATIGGDGWGGGWDSASVQNQLNTNNGNEWGAGSPRRANGGHNAFNTSPRVSDRENNNNNNGGGGGAGWGPSGSGSNRGSNHGRHSNSPPSGGHRHASGGSGNRRSPPQNGVWGDDNHRHGSGSHHHRRHHHGGSSPSRMPGSWESVPSNNTAAQQETPGGRSSGADLGGAFGGRSGGGGGGGTGAFGGFEGTWNTAAGVGSGGGPAWGDPTAAQSTKPAGIW